MLLLGTCALRACTSVSQTQNKWEAGDIQEVRLNVTRRSPVPLGFGQPTPPTDSVTVRLRVDSVVGDSLFGTYEANFGRAGMKVGRLTPGPQVFAGLQTDSTLKIELTPDSDATDAGLRMSGVWKEGSLVGSWMTEAFPRVWGTLEAVKQ